MSNIAKRAGWPGLSAFARRSCALGLDAASARRRSDQGRLQHGADRRGGAQRQAEPAGAGNLARRRQRQGRPAGPAGRTRLLRRPEQSRTWCPASTPSCSASTKSTCCSVPMRPTWSRRRCRCIMQNNKMTISMLGIDVNRQFNYPRYFSMVPGGDEGTLAFSRGWFELAAAQKPKPSTVAIVVGRRRIRQDRLRRRARERQEERLQDRL